MNRKVLNISSFVVIVVALLAVLKLLNWLPSVVQEGMIRRYESIEDVKTKLRIRDVLVPSYYPHRFSWPPSEILAQTKPFLAVIMEFRDAQTKEVGLIIIQSASPEFAPNEKIKLVQVREQVRYQLKGRTAILEVGTCGNEEPCSRMSWDEGARKIHVILKAPPVDIIRIAESMAHSS